jgi:hypothetical protein
MRASASAWDRLTLILSRPTAPYGVLRRRPVSGTHAGGPYRTRNGDPRGQRRQRLQRSGEGGGAGDRRAGNLLVSQGNRGMRGGRRETAPGSMRLSGLRPTLNDR